MSERETAQSFHQLFAPDGSSKKWALNSTQQTLVDLVAGIQGPFIAVIEAPTGIGKTEAFSYAYALRHAARANGTEGLYVALPTMATTNAMFPRMQRFLEKLVGAGATTLHLAQSEARLNPALAALQAHGGNGPSDRSEPIASYDWFNGRKRPLLAQFSVGTVDQIMMAAMRTRHQFVRMFGLYGKTVVIDEIHAYDTYMMDIIRVLLAWLRRIGSPVFLLSATLPRPMRVDLVSAYANQPVDSTIMMDGPNITAWWEDGVRSISITGIEPRTVRFILKPYVGTGDGVVHQAIEAVRIASEAGGCIACVMNTVQDAQAVALTLRSSLPGDVQIIVAHSRFTRKDRHAWEEDLLKLFGKDRTHRPDRAIVVGTQVLEQSLDVDFDAMVTDLAPIDLLIQRAGRIHRHAPDSLTGPRPHAIPTLVVLSPALENFEPRRAVRGIYKSSVLARTAFILAEHGETVVLPGDETHLINAVYGQESASLLPADVEERLMEWDQEDAGTDAKDRVQAGRVVLLEPDECDYAPDLSDLADVFTETADELALTRLGTKSLDVVILDAAPRESDRDSLIENTVRVSSVRLRTALSDVPPPPEWQQHWYLRRAVPLRLVDGETILGDLVVKYDSVYGLQHTSLKHEGGGHDQLRSSQ